MIVGLSAGWCTFVFITDFKIVNAVFQGRPTAANLKIDYPDLVSLLYDLVLEIKLLLED